MPMKPKPSSGVIWLVDLGMAEKIRPVLVLSGACGDTDRDLITFIPHTTTLRGSRFEVAVCLPFLEPGAFLVQSPATVAAPRALKYLGRMQPADVSRIETALLACLEIKAA